MKRFFTIGLVVGLVMLLGGTAPCAEVYWDHDEELDETIRESDFDINIRDQGKAQDLSGLEVYDNKTRPWNWENEDLEVRFDAPGTADSPAAWLNRGNAPVPQRPPARVRGSAPSVVPPRRQSPTRSSIGEIGSGPSSSSGPVPSSVKSNNKKLKWGSKESETPQVKSAEPKTKLPWGRSE
jgi:hypothetical protein